ncbi:MAG: DUF3368 domain-containing protein [Bacteroidetes bacterium]|nr:DUF3368 domain-containing protein [Bacteroidota bacterium]MBU1422620.1 DUF3368 domain-containing protein [Bacteroidota bacterium]
MSKSVIVPPAVIDELEQGKRQGEDVPNIQDYSWIWVQKVKVPDFLKLITDLGLGEAEVLTLALEEPNSLIVLDERLARRIAELRGLKFTGTAGVLLKAKQQGYIISISPILEQLLKLGFRISNRVKNDILKLAGEPLE